MMMAAAQLLKKHGAQEEGVPTNGTKFHGFAANILQGMHHVALYLNNPIGQYGDNHNIYHDDTHLLKNILMWS